LLGYPAEALASLQAALRLYQRLGETENEAGIESLLAQAHEYLGDQERAWRHRDRALSLLTAFPSSPILGRVAGEAATAAISEGKTRTALFYLDYEIDFGMRESNEPLASDALHSRGLLYVALGDKVRGERDLLEARRLADRVADPSVRDRALAELGITQARLTSEAQGDSAIEALTNTLTFFRKTGNHHGTARTLFERALVNRRAGEIGAAKRDLTDAIAELEAVRGRLPQEDLRISYFAKGQRVFEELISILMTEGRGQEAFDVVEQARARALLDDLKPPSGQGGFRTANALRPLDAAAVVKALPKDLAILEYLVLEDRTLVWEVSREGVNLHIINIDALRLEDWVSDLRRALSSPGTAPLDSRSQVDLYTVLVGPAVKLLRQSRTIVLIPDKFLSAVPFAALRDPQDGLYMVEKYRLATSPSATLFLRSLARDSALASSSRRRSDITSGTPLNALIVGNPTLDGQAERLGDLPGAEEETKRVAALFRTSHILRGNEASKARFMELAPFHDVLHFAGHSILNADRAGHSSLVFAAAGSSEDGFLYAHELAAIRLSRARLVFLAACETAAGARAGGEGALSLARAFLASGVPAAIGSLWPVQDLPATELASRFYGHLLAGQDAAAALQSAQLELLRSGNASLSCPTAWAAFQLIGATTLRVSEKGASDG
jgi:CHAT domain-containing protein